MHVFAEFLAAHVRVKVLAVSFQAFLSFRMSTCEFCEK